MPVYHFEIVDGVRLDDPVGLDCQTEQDAKAKADLIARYIAIDLAELVHEPRCVVVLDQDGTEIRPLPTGENLPSENRYR